MKPYKNSGGQTPVCNRCGRQLRLEEPYEEYLEVSKGWGYFSGKDGEDHRFCLCEACYDAWISDFAVPVTVTERTELL